MAKSRSKHSESYLARERLRSRKYHHPKANKRYNYKTRYGITIKQAEQLLEGQIGLCAICNIQISFTENTRACTAHIDHDHITNKIRGVLCQECNIGIGKFKDSINTLLNAINYLGKRKFILLVSPFKKVG